MSRREVSDVAIIRALAFSSYRRFINGAKRAMTSPGRLIALVVSFGYLFLLVPRIFVIDGSRIRLPEELIGIGAVGQEIGQYVFLGFAGLAVLQLMQIASGGILMRSSDVDCLFPLPIRPAIPMALTLLRTYGMTIMSSLVIVLIFRESIGTAVSEIGSQTGQPGSVTSMIGFGALAYILLFLGLIGATQTISIWLFRDRPERPWRRKLVGSIAILMAVAIGAYLFAGFSDMNNLVSTLNSPALRIMLFPATLASWLTVWPLVEGPWGPVGLGGSLAFAVVMNFTAFAQARYLYEATAMQAGTREAKKSTQSKGDFYVATAKMFGSKQKKWKPSWFLNVSGVGLVLASLQMLLLTRTWLKYLLIAINLAFLPMYVMMARELSNLTTRGDEVLLFLAGVMFFVFIQMAHLQGGAIETVRRFDLIKTLPVSNRELLLADCIGKSLVAILFGVLVALCGIIFAPTFAWVHLVLGLNICTLVFFMAATSLAAQIALPDDDDAAQRALRAMVILLGIGAAGLGGLLLGLLGGWIGVPFPITMTMFAAMTVIFAVVIIELVSVSIRNFNPAE